MGNANVSAVASVPPLVLAAVMYIAATTQDPSYWQAVAAWVVMGVAVGLAAGIVLLRGRRQ